MVPFNNENRGKSKGYTYIESQPEIPGMSNMNSYLWKVIVYFFLNKHTYV